MVSQSVDESFVVSFGWNLVEEKKNERKTRMRKTHEQLHEMTNAGTRCFPRGLFVSEMLLTYHGMVWNPSNNQTKRRTSKCFFFSFLFKKKISYKNLFFTIFCCSVNIKLTLTMSYSQMCSSHDQFRCLFILFLI